MRQTRGSGKTGGGGDKQKVVVRWENKEAVRPGKKEAVRQTGDDGSGTDKSRKRW